MTTVDGLTRTLEFETLDDHGSIKSTWMEYVKTAFSRVNDQNAKKIVLHLCKHKSREMTRKELITGKIQLSKGLLCRVFDFGAITIAGP